MRSKWTVVLGAAGFLAVCGSGLAQQVAQERKVVEFTRIGGGGGTFPVRGLVKCVGDGNPAPADQDMPPWCPPGTRTEVRGRILMGKWGMSDPNVSGDARWYMNFSVDSATFTGSWWGTFLVDVPGKGTWEGWFWGESAGNQLAYRAIGVGSGAFDGSTLMVEFSYEDSSSKPPTVKGRYLQPKTP